jgi:hypothetical protein
MFILIHVDESSETPTLPVSMMKFNVSGYPASCALITTIPPPKVEKGTLVISLAVNGTFF